MTANIPGLSGTSQALPQMKTEEKEKGQIAKIDALFKEVDFERIEGTSLKEKVKMIGAYALAAGFIVLIYYALRGSLTATPSLGNIQCRSTTLPQSNTGKLVEALVAQSVQPKPVIMPAKEVEKEVEITESDFDTIDEALQADWNKYSDWEKEQAQRALKNAIGAAVRAKVVCLTGEPFNPNSWHMTVAKFLALPYTGGEEMYTAFNDVKALNENFNNQTISDSLFISICEEFYYKAWLSDQKYSLNNEREWVLNDFKPWMSAVQQVLDVYQKPMRNAFFSELAYDAQTALAIFDLQKYDVAPVRTQIIALDQVRTRAIEHLYQEFREELEYHKPTLLNLLSRSSYYLSHLRIAELTGNSYYERTVSSNTTFLIDNYQEITGRLFQLLYYEYEDDGRVNYQFQIQWDNGLRYYVDHPGTDFHPFSEGFTPQSTANLLALLKSEALRLNGTATYQNDLTQNGHYMPQNGHITVNLSSTIELIEKGVG